MTFDSLREMERKFADLQEIYSHVEMIDRSIDRFVYAYM